MAGCSRIRSVATRPLQYLVSESVEELVEPVREFRASVVARDAIQCRSTRLPKVRVRPEHGED